MSCERLWGGATEGARGWGGEGSEKGREVLEKDGGGGGQKGWQKGEERESGGG